MNMQDTKTFVLELTNKVMNSLKAHVFKVEVSNQVQIPAEVSIKNLKDVQSISGSVDVKRIDEVISHLRAIADKEDPEAPEQLEEITIKDFDKLLNKEEMVMPESIKIENLDGIIKLLEDIKNKSVQSQTDFPSSMKISNLPDGMKVTNMPDSIKISNLGDIEQANEVFIKDFDKLMDGLRSISFLSDSPKRPIAVRLSDGNRFYNAIAQAVVSGGTGKATEAKQDDMIETTKGTMSTNNSTTTTLGIDEVFTGTADDIKDYAAINISIWADQASAASGLSIEWSQNGTDWDEKMAVDIAANKVESYEFGVRARYFRIVYTNGGVAQGAFRLQVILHPTRTRMGARCLCVDIDPREFAATRRAVLAAKKPNGIYTNIHATAGGNLKIAVEESEVDFPIGTGVNGSVTLTNSATAYAVPATASTKNHLITLYNGSDTTISVGYQNTNANGIPIATGKTMELKLGISQQIYAYCASAGKIMTYSYKELT